jgi:hypothetical protein
VIVHVTIFPQFQQSDQLIQHIIIGSKWHLCVPYRLPRPRGS